MLYLICYIKIIANYAVGFGNIAGCIVSDGNIRRNAKVRTMRAGVVIIKVIPFNLLRYSITA